MTDPIAALVAEWRGKARSAAMRDRETGIIWNYCADGIAAATCDTITLPAEDVRRLVRAARAILQDECAGVNTGCRSTDELETALAAPSLAALGEEP